MVFKALWIFHLWYVKITSQKLYENSTISITYMYSNDGVILKRDRSSNREYCIGDVFISLQQACEDSQTTNESKTA